MVDRYTHRRVAEIPRCSSTFSSTLLDSIYRSIDRGEQDEMVVYRDLPRKKNADFDVDFLWMEKNVTRNVVLQTKNRLNSSSGSSCRAGGGGFFTSAEAELQKPKPVSTGKEKLGKKYDDFEINRRDGRGFGDQLEKKPKQEGGKTKSRALKIYCDLKKVKQPISPGGKLAGFLNSIFPGSGNLKKSKISGEDTPSLKSTNTSTCSSASSFSRSCLSKTPSSARKSCGGAKRSVRFFPDCTSLQEEKNNKNNSINSIKSAINEELMVRIMEKNLVNYKKKNEIELPFGHCEEDEDEFDGESYASSDLFELDNLSGIGMDELPVYETTHLDTYRATANIGLIL